MIAVTVRMRDQQRKAGTSLVPQQIQNDSRQRHPVGFRDGACVDQQRLLRTDQQVKEIGLAIRAGTLPQDARLGLITMHLARWLRRRVAIGSACVPAHGQRSRHGLAPRLRDTEQEDGHGQDFHAVS